MSPRTPAEIEADFNSREFPHYTSGIREERIELEASFTADDLIQIAALMIEYREAVAAGAGEAEPPQV